MNDKIDIHSIDEFGDWAFYLDCEVQADDIDSYQHVNNTVYHRWIDDCARHHSTLLGVDPEQASDFGLGMAVLESKVSFVAAALRQDSVRVFTKIVENDQRLKIKRQFEIRNRLNNKLLVRAELVYACINIRTGKAARMPSEFLKAYRL
ncbi:MAG: acyl-CoA thioesterase [Gammaproteobacteria bacterium]|nr:acyl-CoA thioesterase [Gammaproteobacteria bacterium]